MNLRRPGMSGRQTNMFVHIWFCHITFVPPHVPTNHTPAPSCQMGPKPKQPKSNARSGAVHTCANSCKRQGSNADQQPTKWTRHAANDTNNDDDEEHKSEEEQWDSPEPKEEDNDNVVDPPPSRGRKWGRVVRVGPPQRYAGHDRHRSCPYFFLFFILRILIVFFIGKPPTNGLAMMWQRPIPPI